MEDYKKGALLELFTKAVELHLGKCEESPEMIKRRALVAGVTNEDMVELARLSLKAETFRAFFFNGDYVSPKLGNLMREIDRQMETNGQPQRYKGFYPE